MSEDGYGIEVQAVAVGDEDHEMWAASFWIEIQGEQYGWVLGLYESEDEALKNGHDAVLSAMRRTFPAEVGEG